MSLDLLPIDTRAPGSTAVLATAKFQLASGGRSGNRSFDRGCDERVDGRELG